ncbi:hypothetical protein [Streptomyces sp. CS62]|uniref:hypothetical protein n=1 Tax=Streptomyces sp. CS62 TaxID=3119268 RepID=UPI002F93A54A
MFDLVHEVFGDGGEGEVQRDLGAVFGQLVVEFVDGLVGGRELQRVARVGHEHQQGEVGQEDGGDHAVRDPAPVVRPDGGQRAGDQRDVQVEGLADVLVHQERVGHAADAERLQVQPAGGEGQLVAHLADVLEQGAVGELEDEQQEQADGGHLRHERLDVGDRAAQAQQQELPDQEAHGEAEARVAQPLQGRRLGVVEHEVGDVAQRGAAGEEREGDERDRDQHAQEAEDEPSGDQNAEYGAQPLGAHGCGASPMEV